MPEIQVYPKRRSPAQVVQALGKYLREDSNYAETWHRRLAATGNEAGLDKRCADEMATKFLRETFGVEVTHERN